MTLSAKAAVNHGNGTFTSESIDVYFAESDEVLFEITAAGLCPANYDSL